MIVGTLATAIAAFLSIKMPRWYLAALPPIVVNALLLPPMWAWAEAGARIFPCAARPQTVAALADALAGVDCSAFPPVERDPDVIPCASEKEARFITPDIDVGETIECTSDLLEDILEAEENAPQGALKIAIYDEDDLYTFAENQYAVKDALCLWTDVPELLELSLIHI